jgi:hypothetical protein
VLGRTVANNARPSPAGKTACMLAWRSAVVRSPVTLWRRADDKVWLASTSGASGWRRTRWWSAWLTVGARRRWGREAVRRGGVSLAAMCSGGRQRPWGAPTTRGVTGDETEPTEDDSDDRECELTTEGEIGGKALANSSDALRCPATGADKK